MKELINQNDKYGMNWIEGTIEWGTVKVPQGISVSVETRKSADTIVEKYIFTNHSDKVICTSLQDIAIATPFHDDYQDSETCMKNRCHTHIWCGENVSYVMCLRMGGEAPHLGLVLTEGALGGYSVQRDLEKRSNDRGDFMMHPIPVTLEPNESFTIGWTLFWHEGKKDFYEKLKIYHRKYMSVTADNYTVFENEAISFSVEPSFAYTQEDIVITKDGKGVHYYNDGCIIHVKEDAPAIGENVYHISICGVNTYCRILVLPCLEELAGKRCAFIAEKQQYHKADSGLDGAYLIYDNEEEHIFYSTENDYNGGRERVGMGILLAQYLQIHMEEALSESLKQYISYVERELFDCETGVVYNDYHHNNVWNRLYNYPWVSRFYIELYRLYGKKEYLVCAYKALRSFYEQGGSHFYAIEIPVSAVIHCLQHENMTAEKEELLASFRQHCNYIMENGLHYPAHEVNYEQSIVAPAAHILLQTYEVTKDHTYLTAAEEQIAVLDLFHGLQPDYHLYQVAIRHWDGYWFGKKKLYGDTFPHYWNSLSANVYYDYARLTGNKEYMIKCEAVYRGTLSMFMPDGSASCAYVYPVSVNGREAGYYDPYANDQDWGLYLMLRYKNKAL